LDKVGSTLLKRPPGADRYTGMPAKKAIRKLAEEESAGTNRDRTVVR